MSKHARWIPNHLAATSEQPAVIALLCVLLELRVGGILEGLQLEQVDYSHSAPFVGGMVLSFVRCDSMHFIIDTSSVLQAWEGESDSWHYETDGETIVASLRKTLAQMVTNSPLYHATRIEARRE